MLRALIVLFVCVASATAVEIESRPYSTSLRRDLRSKKRKYKKDCDREQKQTGTLHLVSKARPGQLQSLLSDLYNPKSSRYRQWLTPESFGDAFGAADSDVESVREFLRESNLTFVSVDKNKLFLDFEGAVEHVNAAFQTKLAVFSKPHVSFASGVEVEDGADEDEFIFPLVEPRIPKGLPVLEVFGLESEPNVRKPRFVMRQEDLDQMKEMLKQARANDSNDKNMASSGKSRDDDDEKKQKQEEEGIMKPRFSPDDSLRGLSPDRIRKAYNIDASETGAGQVVAIIQYARYKIQDMDQYAAHFKINPRPPIENVDLGLISTNQWEQVEASLDCQMVMALAPGVKKIIHYNAANTNQGSIDAIRRMAQDNIAAQGTTSWGAPEAAFDRSTLQAQHGVFAQMAAQGQAFFAASGDFGAHDLGDKVTLAVDSPASHPWVSGIGGTSLSVKPDGSRLSETTWRVNIMGGGGGVSEIWAKPDYQVGVGPGNMRLVPDISMNANPEAPSGAYWIVNNGFWMQQGGTSAGSPLFAAFTALVNARRQKAGLSRLGNFNKALYGAMQIGNNYAQSVFDIKDGSNNGHYVAGTSYDMSTGWGTPNGRNLITLLGAGSFINARTESPVPSTGERSQSPAKNPSAGNAATARPTRKPKPRKKPK